MDHLLASWYISKLGGTRTFHVLYATERTPQGRQQTNPNALTTAIAGSKRVEDSASLDTKGPELLEEKISARAAIVNAQTPDCVGPCGEF